MEDRKLNETESLELITRMIQNSKKNVTRNAGGPLLIWGYATVITSLLVYAGWMLTKENAVMFGWFLIPVFGGLGNLWFGRRNKAELTKTHLDFVIGSIWMVLGLVCMGVSVSAFFFSLPILFFVAILMGAGSTLTGCVTKHRVLTNWGIIGILLSFLCLVVRGPEQILAFAGIFLVMMVVPGHILNAETKKEENTEQVQ